jgi:farnesyl-diphosphate farnesyltransferase
MPTLDQVLRATSRTFAIGIERLPQPLREEVKLAYLVLRISDYIEDNRSMAPERKAELLERWHAVLHEKAPLSSVEAELENADDDLPDAQAARHVAQVHAALADLTPRAREVIVHHAGDSTLGMARWVARGPDFADEADLDDYMHEVAGRVGFLLTELFSARSGAVRRNHDEMMRLGREFGLGLQTVNVIRGLHEDHERGWVFVPRSFLDQAGAGAEVLFDPAAPGPGLRVLSILTDKADRHLDAARRYIAGIERRHHGIRVFCLLPYFFAVATVEKSRRNPEVFTHEVKIARDAVRAITRDTALLGVSNRWIQRYAKRLG